ncbi:MAG TPA: deoxyribonuclease IV [Gemmatimonadaceae bacterium]|nr:deoxyribonuclease IV [Gemmatimonadaceae bacterium]
MIVKRGTAIGPIGAHVSVAGGTHTSGPRAKAIRADAVQIFTKNANQWRERLVDKAEARAFKAARKAANVRFACSHDSYLINLASPDAVLRARSLTSFIAELERSKALGLDAVVSHPGNYMDDRERGLARNAEAITAALTQVRGKFRLLIEGTAGAGTALGGTFEELAQLRALMAPAIRKRVGVCLDTCHLYVAGYDLVGDYDAVWTRFDDIVGLELLGCLHLNDTQSRLGSKLDRHEVIGKGVLGRATFQRIMTDPRLAHIPKLIETPKGDDEVSNDRRAISLLRRLSSY